MSHAFKPQLSVFRICTRICGSTLSTHTVEEVRWDVDMNKLIDAFWEVGSWDADALQQTALVSL